MKNNCRFLFLMDPYESLNLATETSLLIMEELQARGHQVYWLEKNALYLNQGDPRANIAQLQSIAPFVLGEKSDQSLNDFDAVLVRFDPPFDSNYLHKTYLLDYLNDDVFQFNSISALRNFNEKLLPMKWPEITPATIVSMEEQVIMAFAEKHENIIVKPLDDCSGRGIEKLSYSQLKNDPTILSTLLCDSHEQARYLVVQKFMEAVSKGDKRVYMVAGEVAGSVNRIPKQDSFLANIHQGASCEKTELSKKEMLAIETIRPFIIDNGLLLVGVDFIDELVTEINITSPSAVRQINQVMGIQLQKFIVDKMLLAMKEKCDVRCVA